MARDPILAGRYYLRGALGSGATAQVFLAWDRIGQVPVAIKLPSRTGLGANHAHRLLWLEAMAARCVEHPGLVRVMDSGCTEDGEPFLVLEALAGETLGEYLRRERRMPPPEALRVVRGAAEALHAVHVAGIVHRDVKPDNLFLCDEERHGVRVKVFDFGFAGPCGTDSERTVLGTPEYMAPEQVLADHADARTDVYALGVVLFRLLTGELPFDVGARLGLVTHQLFSPAPPPSWLLEDLDPGVETLTLTALRKHPENRYPTMEALLADIDRVLVGQPISGVSPEVEPDVFRPTTELGRAAWRSLKRSLGRSDAGGTAD